MKKYVYLIGIVSIVLITGMIFISCAGGSPSSVVKQLHTAIEKGDTKAISELATSDAAQMLLLIGEKAKGMISEKGGIIKTEETISGDTAVVKVTYKDGETEDFDLIKENGKWKVSINK